MENLTQDVQVSSRGQSIFDLLNNSILKEESYDHEDRSCQPVNGVISDKDIKTEYVDPVQDDVQITKSIKGLASNYLTVWKSEKIEERETNVIPENGIDRKDMILEVTNVKKEQTDNLLGSDSNSESSHDFSSDEKIESLIRTSDKLVEKLRAVCNEMKEEKVEEMHLSQMESLNILYTTTSSSSNSPAVQIKMEPETGSEKSDFFSCDMCCVAFSQSDSSLRHIGRVCRCGYGVQQSKSETTVGIHKKSNTTVAGSREMNYSIPTACNVTVQRLETESLSCVTSRPGENHLTEQNTGQQVAQDCSGFSLHDIKHFESNRVLSKTFVKVTKHSDLNSGQKYDHLQLNTRIDTGEKPHKCDAGFAEAHILQAQERNHTGKKPYKCDVCGVGFARTDHLQAHKRIHTGEKPYKCDVCGVDFAQRYNLQRHKRKHTGEKPYKCDVCGVDFAQRYNLYHHKRKHTGGKPHKCGVCGVDFARTSDLQVHKRIHIGEKPYKCDVCGVGFARPNHLQAHKRIHTGEKPYKCDVCGVGFSQIGSLQRHKKRKHTREEPYN